MLICLRTPVTCDANLKVINISSIVSVVSMQPLPKLSSDEFGSKKMVFVVEKSGLEDTELTGYIDPLNVVDS